MEFDFGGNIVVIDDLGAGGVFVDTGVAFIQDQYVEASINLETVAGNIEYSYNGSVIYTGNIWAGTRVEQIILASDNFQGLAGNPPDAFGDLKACP
jgi:hypothetical protein